MDNFCDTLKLLGYQTDLQMRSFLTLYHLSGAFTDGAIPKSAWSEEKIISLIKGNAQDGIDDSDIQYSIIKKKIASCNTAQVLLSCLNNLGQAQRGILRPKNSERQQMQAVPELDRHACQIGGLLSTLGFVDEITPDGNEDVFALLILGAAEEGVQIRLGFASTLIDQKVIKPKLIILVSGARPLWPKTTIGGEKAGENIALELLIKNSLGKGDAYDKTALTARQNDVHKIIHETESCEESDNTKEGKLQNIVNAVCVRYMKFLETLRCSLYPKEASEKGVYDQHSIKTLDLKIGQDAEFSDLCKEVKKEVAKVIEQSPLTTITHTKVDEIVNSYKANLGKLRSEIVKAMGAERWPTELDMMKSLIQGYEGLRTIKILEVNAITLPDGSRPNTQSTLKKMIELHSNVLSGKTVAIVSSQPYAQYQEAIVGSTVGDLFKTIVIAPGGNKLTSVSGLEAVFSYVYAATKLAFDKDGANWRDYINEGNTQSSKFVHCTSNVLSK